MTYDNKKSVEEQWQYTYENVAEARRVTLTDGDGNKISDSNRLPVDAIPPKTKVIEFIGQLVNENVLTPTAGKRLKIHGILIDSSATNACCARLTFVNDAGVLVWRNFFDKAKAIQSWMPINITGGTNESLVVNTINMAAANELFVAVAYDEVD